MEWNVEGAQLYSIHFSFPYHQNRDKTCKQRNKEKEKTGFLSSLVDTFHFICLCVSNTKTVNIQNRTIMKIKTWCSDHFTDWLHFFLVFWSQPCDKDERSETNKKKCCFFLIPVDTIIKSKEVKHQCEQNGFSKIKWSHKFGENGISKTIQWYLKKYGNLHTIFLFESRWLFSGFTLNAMYVRDIKWCFR